MEKGTEMLSTIKSSNRIKKWQGKGKDEMLERGNGGADLEEGHMVQTAPRRRVAGRMAAGSGRAIRMRAAG